MEQAVPAWSKPVWYINSWVLLFLPAGLAQQFQESLLKYCSLPGLQQQGIFRVPGSQVEVNDIRTHLREVCSWGVQIQQDALSKQGSLVGVGVC